MKRVLFVSNTLAGGGAERVLANLTMGLPEEYEPVLLLNDDTPAGYPFRGAVRTLGLPPRRNKRSLLYQARLFFARRRALKRLKAEGGLSAVVSFSDSAALADLLSPAAGCRSVVSVHNSVSESARLYPKYRLLGVPLVRLLYGRADAVVAVSRGIAAELTGQYGLPAGKVTAIANGVDIAAIDRRIALPPSPEAEAWCEGGNVLVSMGRLVQAKGHWHLLRALQVPRDEGIPFRLLLLGEGELRPYLQELTKDLGLEGAVVFCGFREEPFDILSRADVAVFPSLHEGFSCAVAEAMACGLPCVVTDHPTGARELLAPGTDPLFRLREGIEVTPSGLLVPVCDGTHYGADAPLTKEERLLGEAIARMLRDEGLRERCGRAARERALGLDAKAMAMEWLRIIDPEAG